MTAIYIVTGVKVRFGPGFVLALDQDQAALRSSSLLETKRKGEYEVLESVEFKQGEKIGVIKGDIPKSWWDTLNQVSAKARPEPDAFKAVHRGFGKWDVVDGHDEPINTHPLTKEEAQSLLAAQDGDEDGDENPKPGDDA